MDKHHIRQLELVAIIIVFIATLSPLTVQAGGLTLYEVGTPDVGYASAGYAARADDPGTVLTNPAGMTRLKGKQLLLGTQILYGDVKFSPSQETTVAGGNGGNALGLLPALSTFGTYAVNKDLSVGIGMFSNFGLGLWYDSDWAGRYYADDAVLIGISIMPAIAYRITERLSVGVGLNIMYGYHKNTVAINNIDPGMGDGRLKLKDGDIGIGANVGILYELSKGTRFGVTYSSPVKLDFSDTPEFSGTGPGITTILNNRGLYASTLDLGITVPQSVMASFYTELNDQWALLGNFGWQDWSEFGKIDVSLSSTANPALTTNLKYKDTWHGALGAQCDLRKDIQLGFAYEYVYSGSPRINASRGPLSGTLAGEYPDMSIQFFTANVTRKF